MDIDLEQEERPFNWDPEPERRQWYSNKRTGDEGWLVIREGKDCVKLNRPNQEITPEFHPGEWVKHEDHRQMTPFDVAMVCHIADQMLCQRAQLYPEKRPDWLNLRPEQKRKWCDDGPAHPLRKKLYVAIREALKEHMS